MNDIASESLEAIDFNPTPEVLKAFSSNKIFFGRVGDDLSGHLIRFPKHIIAEPYSTFPARRIFNCGSFSYCESRELPHNISLGRYCSVAFGVQVLGVRHPIEWVTSSSMLYDFADHVGYQAFVAAQQDLLGGRHQPSFPDRLELPPPVVGHDVWIGQRAQIARGISLGTGCVVAAGAVVTHDVPPYSIVGGVPARLIRTRFDDVTIARLLASEWWTYHPSVLYRCHFKDPVTFLDQFEAAKTKGDIELFRPPGITWISIINEIAPRTIIEMSSNHLCLPYLKSGWCQPEPEFTWALGPSSILELPYSVAHRQESIELDLFPVPFRPQAIEINILLDGARITIAKQSVDPHNAVKCRLVPEWVRPDRPLVLEVIHPNFAKPSSFGFNDDERELSVALRRVTLRSS